MKEWLERLREHQRAIAIAAVVITWSVAFRWGFASSDWGGMWWGAEAPTRGNAVVIKEQDVQTTVERQGRLAKQKKELGDTLKELKDVARTQKKSVVGERHDTRGMTPREEASIDPEVASWTQRDVCFNMKLEFPERYGDIDCMAPEYDDKDPWYKAPNRAGKQH